jgi:hypothetical protein
MLVSIAVNARAVTSLTRVCDTVTDGALTAWLRQSTDLPRNGLSWAVSDSSAALCVSARAGVNAADVLHVCSVC